MAAIPRVRARSGPALLSYGFRPFFLLAGLQALWTVGLWTGFRLGLFAWPFDWPPVAWHAHELLFGYGSAALSGFLLTAIPNWTGRLPLSGRPLAGLAGSWVLGRLAVLASHDLPAVLVASVSLAFPAALLLATAREVLIGKNRPHYPVIGLLALFALAWLGFHLELAGGAPAPVSSHLGIAALLLQIGLVGGRILPSFTTNWLRRHRPEAALPVPFDRFDKGALLLAAFALALLVVRPIAGLPPALCGAAALSAGFAHLFRLWRWRPFAALSEPLLWSLHLGYFFLPAGFLAAGVGLLLDRSGLSAAATHLWTVGAIGGTTLAVMTRATRGHTGRALTAPPATALAYAALAAAALLRAGADLAPQLADLLVPSAGIAWLFAFAIFLRSCAPMLLGPRVQAGSPP
ncbi:MAG: NnrS family protein [Geminicoccaceae bacterium]|nr:NnrS family protein [Geminicoccaceae bacterium]